MAYLCLVHSQRHPSVSIELELHTDGGMGSEGSEVLQSVLRHEESMEQTKGFNRKRGLHVHTELGQKDKISRDNVFPFKKILSVPKSPHFTSFYLILPDSAKMF